MYHLLLKCFVLFSLFQTEIAMIVDAMNVTDEALRILDKGNPVTAEQIQCGMDAQKWDTGLSVFNQLRSVSI